MRRAAEILHQPPPRQETLNERKEKQKWLRLSALVKLLSRVRLFATPWTVAYEAPPSMEFSRQEYWSGLPFPSA